MKKKQIQALTAAWLMVVLFSGVVSAKIVYVPDDFSRIESAIEAAEDKDIVLISDEFTDLRDIRSIDTGGKALTIAVSKELTTSQGCPKIYDFEDFDEDEIITSQIPGVDFEVIGNDSVGLHIEKEDWYYNDFPSKVLMIDTHPQGFSPDYFQMIFDKPQYQVRFNLGPATGWYYIRAYNAASGGTQILFKAVNIKGDVFTGTQQPITLSRSSGDIKRVVVKGQDDIYEAIDDLSFGLDPTPPEVLVDLPGNGDCVSDIVSVQGFLCDPDGEFDRDRLEYRRVHPEPDDDWILVREFVNSAVCSSGDLYSWDTRNSEIIDGVYLLRVTAINGCGLSSSREIMVYVSNEFDNIDIQSPESKDIVGGDICFEGTVWDWNCFDNYTVRYRPTGGAFWSPVDSVPSYDTTRTNQPFADWNYPSDLTDGIYEIQVTGTTTTGKTLSKSQKLVLDNTPPTAIIDSPDSCTDPGELVTIMGTAHDENLREWRLDYWNPVTEEWDPIKTSKVSVVKGLLATWTRGSADGCPDVLRLKVWDEARVNPCSTSEFGNDRHMTETFVILAEEEGGICHGDYDGDGDVDAFDLSEFAGEFGGSCP